MKRLVFILLLTTNTHAFFDGEGFDRLLTQIYWQGKDLTILVNGTIIDNLTGDILSYPKSETWEEEDFFTQQDKYCEKGTE